MTRWDELFGDLEGQAASLDSLRQAGEVAEVTRAEQAAISLVERLREVVGAAIKVELRDGEMLSGQLRRVAEQWLLLDGNSLRGHVEHLIPLPAVSAVSPLTRRAHPSVRVTDSLGLGSALRGLQRDRAAVVLSTSGGQVSGRLSRVGKDHVDVTPGDIPGAEPQTVRFAALLRVSQP